MADMGNPVGNPVSVHHSWEIRCQFIILARKDEPTSKRKSGRKSDVSSSFLPEKRNRHRAKKARERCTDESQVPSIVMTASRRVQLEEIRCQFIILTRKDEPTSRKKARERRIVGSLKPFRWNPAGNQSRPVEPDQQPEASLAWRVGDHPCEA